MLRALTEMFERNACDQRNALANRHHSGVHWLVLSVSAQLSPPGENEARTRHVGQLFFNHSSINRWTIRFLSLLEKVFCKYKCPVGVSWRLDETYIKVKGVWKYLYRAVGKAAKTVDFPSNGQAGQGCSPALVLQGPEGQRCSRKVLISIQS